MKKVLSLLALTVLSVAAFSFVAKVPATPYSVDVKESKVEWTGTKESGYHSGTFDLKSGTLNVENNKLTGGTFVIDLNSLKVSDAAGGTMLEGHLKGKGFFNTEVNKEATFEITSVKYINDKKASIEGNVTLAGVKAKVSFVSSVNFFAAKEGQEISKFFGHTTFSIDRTLLGLTAAPGHIDNNVEISVNLFAGK